MNNLLAENIKKYRKELNMTQDELAEKLGITLGTISKWERGNSEPDVDYIMDLAEIFQVSVDVLLGFNMRGNNLELILERINKLWNERKLKEALNECDVALMKFPNNLKVVQSAANIEFLYAYETDDKEYFAKSKEHFKHSLELFSQNDDPSVTEFDISNMVANCHLHLDEFDDAIKIYKKNNINGSNNSVIGLTYVHELHDLKEGEKYIVNSFLNIIKESLTTSSAFTILFREKQDCEKCLRICEWLISLMISVKEDKDKPFFGDKFISMYYLISGFCYEGMGNLEKADEFLIKAVEKAKDFDSNPCLTLSNIICAESLAGYNTYDDYGVTAVDGLKKVIEESKEYFSDEFHNKFYKLIGENNEKETH